MTATLSTRLSNIDTIALLVAITLAFTVCNIPASLSEGSLGLRGTNAPPALRIARVATTVRMVFPYANGHTCQAGPPYDLDAAP